MTRGQVVRVRIESRNAKSGDPGANVNKALGRYVDESGNATCTEEMRRKVGELKEGEMQGRREFTTMLRSKERSCAGGVNHGFLHGKGTVESPGG